MEPQGKSNRLAQEKSPYLLQHASNPIDWWPWQKEIFEQAQQRDCPIFLSIGYATCHWCHVMEKESFNKQDVADVLNEHFVSVKLDRQEYPDVDSFYMEIAQLLMSSAGGWPLNLILTPEGKPFFAFTYLPADSRRGIVGLKDVLKRIATLWNGEEREVFIRNADKWMQIYKKEAEKQDLPSTDSVTKAVENLLKLADPIFGGFKGEPKFPLSYMCDFLLRYSCSFQEERTLFFLELSLQKMAFGGLFDHLGGGFFRYVVDQGWHIPHFEKMLPENALLASAYMNAWKATGNPLYEKICKSTLDYIVGTLRQDSGVFCSGEDADSEGEEGKYYLWNFEEIEKILPYAQLYVFCHAYGVTREGNFRNKNILHQTDSFEAIQEKSGLDAKTCKESLDDAWKQLKQAASLRERPFLDEQVVVAWNAWAISALAKAARAFDSEVYRKSALDAAVFIRDHLYKEGQLFRSYCKAVARGPACLEDYAALIHAFLTLFEEGMGTEWLLKSLELNAVLESKFSVKEGAFYTSQEDSLLPVRRWDFYDGAEPSGNAVQAENLVRLYQISGDKKFITRAEDVFCSMKKHVETYPSGAGYTLAALLRFLDEKAPCCFIALDENETGRKEIAEALAKKMMPHGVFVWIKKGDEALLSAFPYLIEKKTMDEKTTFHVCYKNRCDPPINDLLEILEKIGSL